MENFSSEAWDSSECAAAREPLRALEQGEVVGCGCTKGRVGGLGGSENVWVERVIVTATHTSTWCLTVEM